MKRLNVVLYVSLSLLFFLLGISVTNNYASDFMQRPGYRMPAGNMQSFKKGIILNRDDETKKESTAVQNENETVSAETSIELNRKNTISIAIAMVRLFFEGKFDSRYDLNDDNKVDRADLALLVTKFFGGKISQAAEDKIKLILLGDMDISTLASHGQSTVDTTVKGSEIIVGESIVAKPGVGYTWAYNLVNGEIHYKAVGDGGQVMDNIITPDQKEQYINALDSMLNLVNSQVGLEADAANKEKLQTVADFLADVLAEQTGLEQISIATPTEKLPDGTVVAQITTEVKGSELTVKESGASGAFGITTLNLATGTITIQDKTGIQTITAQETQAYAEALQNMLGVIDRQIEKETDAANKEKLQTVADFLTSKLPADYYWGGSLEDVKLTISNPGIERDSLTIQVADDKIYMNIGAGSSGRFINLDLKTGTISYGSMGGGGSYQPSDEGYKGAIVGMISDIERMLPYATAEQKTSVEPVKNYLESVLLKQQGYIKLTGTIKVNDAAPSGGSGNLMAGPSIYLETENGTYAVKNPTSYYADPLWQELIPLKGTKVMLYANISPISPYSGYKGYLENLKNIVPIR